MASCCNVVYLLLLFVSCIWEVVILFLRGAFEEWRVFAISVNFGGFPIVVNV